MRALREIGGPFFCTEVKHDTIHTWSEEDRPREKLIRNGTADLTDSELLALLLGSGTHNESAVGLSRRILQTVDHDLNELARCTPGELTGIKGVGPAKAATISAAFELGRRRADRKVRDRPTIRSSQDAYLMIASQLADLHHEEFWILLLNRANKLIDRSLISRGGITGTVADSRLIFKLAIERRSTAIILCHNHPSGNLVPSEQDVKLTEKMKQAGRTLDIPVLDHLIVSDAGYYSFADEGRI